MAKHILSVLNQLKNLIYLPRINEIAKSTIPFFELAEKQEYKSVGSGLFMCWQNAYYVISAAHVLAEHLESTFTIIENNAIPIFGKSLSSPLPQSGSRADDKIDLTIIKIDIETANELLKNYVPIEEAQIKLPHDLVNFQKYFVFGYPSSRTIKVWGANKIKSLGYNYQSIPSQVFDFTKFGFSQENQIAIDYDGGVTSASNPTNHLTPDLAGISGSGLWYFDKSGTNYIIGVVIEEIDIPLNKVLLSTKIEQVLLLVDALNLEKQDNND